MILATLLSAAVSGQLMSTKIGDWTVKCFNDTAADDGLFDRCEMREKVSGFNISGVTFIATRDAKGISVKARMKGCKRGDDAPPAVIPLEVINGPDADKKFIGAEFLAMNSLMKRCRSRNPGAVSLGGAEIVDLLAATSRIRTNAS